MKNIFVRRLLTLCLGFLILTFHSCKKESADLVIYGGPIYTVVEKSATVEAVVIKGNKIIFAGKKSEAVGQIGENTKVIDLNGRTMTPGFIEGHAHIVEMALQTMRLDLSHAASFEAIISIIDSAAKKARPGDWIIGDGWHQDKWVTKPKRLIKGFPVHTELSKISPDNPVFLRHTSGHAGIVNSRAMELIGVNPLKREGEQIHIDGGEIIRDENGNPTGLFNENAVTLIENKIQVTDEDLERSIEDVMQYCLRMGITSFHDAGENERYVSILKKFRKENKLKIRLYVMLSGMDTTLVRKYLKSGIEVDPENWLTVRSIKYYCDGALGSRGAWLLEPYSDDAQTSGMVVLPTDSLLTMTKNALDKGFQVCTHAIGDRANREVLDKYEQAFKENPAKAKNSRFRIEHAQHINPDDIGRFASLGVLPAMQAIHMSSDRPWAIYRLGAKRIQESAYVWQSLLKSGTMIINGTDAPVEPVNPIPCFYASVTRKTLKGEPKNGYEAEQKMTRQQALHSYTLAPAYGAFEENLKGSIEPGKLADFTVFSKDILTIPDEEILTAEVVMTIIDGKVVYEK